MTIERIISVAFRPDASKEIIHNFFHGIEELSQLFKDDVVMSMHHSILREHEKTLSNAVDTSHYADCVSIWKFDNEESLERFLSDGRHKAIAKQYFRNAVATRTVINIKRP